MKRLPYYFLVFIFSAQIVLAQAEDFKVSVTLFGADTTPPTTPVLLAAAPMTDSQINISWSASTDNILLSGYSILRDGIPLATTTLLTYSDTGLAASTSYSYAVRAFDPSLNYSTTSNSLATTTLDTPPPAAAVQGTASRVVVNDFRIETGISTSSLILSTVRPARIEVRWGRTASYELGYLVSSNYSKEHSPLLNELEPGTKYEYEIIGYSQRGNESIVRSGFFVTKSEFLIQPVENVSQFTALQNDMDAFLSWQLPGNGSADKIRIVRSHLRFPEHVRDGAVVYQGNEEQFIDTDILSFYSPVYYTAFVYDGAGNISSGAVAIVYADAESSVPNQSFSIDESEGTGFVEEATSSINTERVTVDMKMPTPSEIEIVQNDKIFTFLESRITLISEQNFLVSISKNTISGNLKTIIVTVVDPTDNRKSFSYLLRINSQQTSYEALVPMLSVIGKSQLTLEIYDYEAFVVAKYKVPVEFENSKELKAGLVAFPDVAYRFAPSVFIIFLIVLMLLLLFMYRRNKDNN